MNKVQNVIDKMVLKMLRDQLSIGAKIEIEPDLAMVRDATTELPLRQQTKNVLFDEIVMRSSVDIIEVYCDVMVSVRPGLFMPKS